jgi:hypothetical protein
MKDSGSYIIAFHSFLYHANARVFHFKIDVAIFIVLIILFTSTSKFPVGLFMFSRIFLSQYIFFGGFFEQEPPPPHPNLCTLVFTRVSCVYFVVIY